MDFTTPPQSPARNNKRALEFNEDIEEQLMAMDFEELESIASLTNTPQVNAIEDEGVEETKESEPVDPFQTPAPTIPAPEPPAPLAPQKRPRGKPEMVELLQLLKKADAERRTDTRRRVMHRVSLLPETDLKKVELFIKKICAKRYVNI